MAGEIIRSEPLNYKCVKGLCIPLFLPIRVKRFYNFLFKFFQQELGSNKQKIEKQTLTYL
jgi:hypothetical protein